MPRLHTLAVLPLAGLLAGCPGVPTTGKPTLDMVQEKAAQPKLQAYLARVLGGEGKTAKLTGAEQFVEGHVYETWRLQADVGGKPAEYTLKVFPGAAVAARDAENHQQARELGWPVPDDVVRGTLEPYSSKPGSLRVYVPGESLSMKLRARLQTGEGAEPAAVAALYAQVGEALGRLHAKGLRARKEGDISGAALVAELAKRCESEAWCGADTAKGLVAEAGELDAAQVTFIHGDLYESQVIVDDAGKLVSFIDLDEAGWGDPAIDLGSLLAHVLIVNAEARQAVMGAANPTPEELKATGTAILSAYQKAAGLGDAWPAFAGRVQTYMRTRVGQLLFRLGENPHAKPLIEQLDKKKAALLTARPFTRYGIEP